MSVHDYVLITDFFGGAQEQLMSFPSQCHILVFIIYACGPALSFKISCEIMLMSTAIFNFTNKEEK